MIKTDQNIYIQETEIKPNTYAKYILTFTTFIVVLCWVVTELGIFRVGKNEMRIGSIVTFVVSITPILLMQANKELMKNPIMKYIVISAASCFTMVVGTFLTFHTTIMLLFPVLFAMLYRSKPLGILAVSTSLFCTIVTPILGYLLGTWDIPLFEELILIGTNGGVAEIIGGGDGPSWLNIGKILLYLVGPRTLMIGSCAILLFNNIRLGVDHVNNQILLNQISNIDAPTGLFNKNCYMDFVESIKKEKPFQMGVVYFDVNGLKAVNDAKGHEYGDILLKRCADSLLAVCNKDDMAAFRVGGDEFMLVIKDASESVLIQKVSEWENKLAVINEENKTSYEGIVCSMAVGYASGSNTDLEEVIHQADTFMYQNKARQKAMRE